MTLLQSDIIKFKILKELYKQNKELTFYAMNKNIRVKATSVISNCEFLKMFDFIKIRSELAPNGKTFRYISLTDKGRKHYEQIKDKKELK